MLEIARLMPYRVELQGRDELLEWLLAIVADRKK